MNYIKKISQIAIVSLALLSANAFAEVSVIVHKSNAASVSVDEIKRIFLGKSKKFSDGASAVPINLSASVAVRSEFDDAALSKSTNQTKAYWSKLVFSGKGNPPKEVSSMAEMIELVSKNPSLIGYVDSASVTGDVKVVATF